MKKVLIILGIITSSIIYSENRKLEIKLGGDLAKKYSHEYNNISEDTKFSYEVSLEYRREFFKNTEFGLGIAYQDHGKLKDSTTSYYQSGTGYTDFTTKGDLYNSVPLYLTARYNFKNSSEYTPYIKANLGYSFNVNNGSIDTKWKNSYTGREIGGGFDVDAKDGLYYAIGSGFEYRNFIFDLSYQVNTSKVKLKDNYGHNKEDLDADFERITLGIGYNFNF